MCFLAGLGTAAKTPEGKRDKDLPVPAGAESLRLFQEVLEEDKKEKAPSFSVTNLKVVCYGLHTWRNAN